MIVKISGETPFQVLSTQFSIGPSTSGYDLYFSADGVNYTQLFTVGANVNRQVTQVAAGSYYKLVGNTGNVVVNWYGNCVVDSGGGGTQYTAGNGIQISGNAISVKAGEGLSFSGDTLIATGGGSDMFVLELSTLESEDLTNDDKANIDALFAYLSGKTIDEINAVLINPDSTDQQLYKLTYTDGEGIACFNALWSCGGEEIDIEKGFDEGTGDDTYSILVDSWEVPDYAGGDGISIEDDTVSVNIGPGLTLDNKGYNQVMAKLGEGLHFVSGDTIGVEIGEGLAFSGNTLVVSGGKTPIILEEHYGDPDWLAIYNAVAQSAVTMGIEEFAKKYDIYIKKLDDQDNPYALYQAVGYAMQEGQDWDEDLQEDVQTTWITFYTFENVGYTYWLLSTGSRGLGAITGFNPDSVAHPKSAWINIDTSGNVIDYNIEQVDGGLAQYNDNGTDYAFSMYLVCTPGDAERYRGNLQNFRKSYNNVNGDFFFRFVIDIEGTEYEAEYYWDSQNQQIAKIVFQPYKTYLQSILNS